MRAYRPMLVSILVSVVSLSCTIDFGTAPNVPVASLSVEPTSAIIQVGTATQLSAIARDSSGGTLSGRVTTWTSSDRSIAMVGAAGVVSGVAPGSAEVIATVEGKSGMAAITVTSTPGSPPPPPAVCTGVSILPGASIQAAVNANPAGSTFCLRAGTHRRQSVVPKAGDRFLGDPGAVLDGEDVTVYAFDRGYPPYPSDVVIRGVKITRYNPPFQMGAIRAGDAPKEGGVNWVVENNEISYNATGGIRIADGMRIRNNNVHHNKAIGIVGIGDDVLVEGNEIAWNNWLKEYSWGGEAGGTKFVRTQNLIARDNYSHDNWGPGLWTDIFNRNALYEGNRVEDNAGPGIFHEISYEAVIRNNTIKRNGFNFAGWIWGGGIQISTSYGVEIYGNTLEDNKVGVSIVEQWRGYPDLVSTDINVYDNTITQRTGVPAGAANDIPGHDPVAYYGGIVFARNSYFVRTTNQSSFEWWDDCCQSWAKWQAYGQDVAGTLTIIP